MPTHHLANRVEVWRAIPLRRRELREAERGFPLMLCKWFSAIWIRNNAKDLLGQAIVEYAQAH